MSSRPTKRALGTLTAVLRRRDWLLAKIFAGAGVAVAALFLWSLWPYWRLSGEFETIPKVQPSRLYGRPLRLSPGQGLSVEQLVTRLGALSYHAANADGLTPGRFHASGSQVAVARRKFRAAVGDGGGGVLVVDFRGERISRLLLDETAVAEAWLEPPLLATFYGEDLLERRPARLDEIPSDVVRAVLAAEDAAFFEHPGLSPTGIARALWTNLRGGEVRQGGSTITQQLAKNLYLSSERTMGRKLREAMLAVFLEWRYSKEEILEAYLNQIFWGRSGAANLIGVGAAAWGTFGKPVGELDLAEGALLAAMIKSPGEYAPLRKPEAARGRRDFVLDRLAGLGWVTREAADARRRRSRCPRATWRSRIGSRPTTPTRSRPRWPGVGRSTRWRTPASPSSARSISRTRRRPSASSWRGSRSSPRRSERVRKKEDVFQGALVSLEPASGAVRAWVGGRDYRESQFDRVGQARRQAGSAFKPLVYAAAFEAGVATPATLLEDAPLEMMSGGKLWTPANDDDKFRGWVTARTAIEQSLNVPTARLALQVGLPTHRRDRARGGHRTRLAAVPSIALGAFEVAPFELATAYATLANRGVRPPVRLVDGGARPRRRAVAGRADAGAAPRALGADRLPRDHAPPGRARLRHGGAGARARAQGSGGGQDRHHQQPRATTGSSATRRSARHSSGSASTTTRRRRSRARRRRCRSGPDSCSRCGRPAAIALSRRRRGSASC